MTSNVDGEGTPIDAVNSRTSIIPELRGKKTLHVGFSVMTTSQILAHGDFEIAVLSNSRR
jgi:hypothetical protein